MKKISRATLVLVMLIVVALVAVACPRPSGSDIKISIAANEMPMRTTYVQGENLELFGGLLTVEENGETKKVPLESPDITITGYDNTKTGQQELTVSYSGATTTLTVTVIKRISVANAELNYFVGEKFDASKGDITLTKNDGSVQTGSLSQATISGLEDFSATAGVKNLTISFGGFTDTLTVNVYEIADAKFNAPSRRAYESHETAMDLTGAVITLKDAKAVANQGGVTKNVTVTNDMVSGFNPAAATIENRETALVQPITITYAGKEFNLNINVSFSDVSMIGYNAQYVADIDWNADDLEFSDEQIEKSTEAAELYFGLTEDERALINAEELANVMRVAAAYTYNNWYNSMVAIKDVLELSYSSGTGVADINFVATSYEEAKENYQILIGDESTDKIAEIGELNDFLWLILSDVNLSAIVMYGDATTGEYTIKDHCMFAVPQARVAEVISELQFAIQLYEKVEGIALEDVVGGASEETAALIEDATKFIMESVFYGKKPMFTKVSNWTNDVMFDAIYQYYWDRTVANYNDTEAWNNLVMLTPCYLPGLLEDYYNYAVFAYQGIEDINAQMELYENSTIDSTAFLYYYFEMMNVVNEIKNGDNELHKNLLEQSGIFYPFHSEAIPAYLLIDDYDYFYRSLVNEMYGVEEFENLLKDYFVIIRSYVNGDYFVNNTQYSDLFKTEIPEFVEKFISYSPTIQAYFLMNIHSYGALNLLDITADPYTYLSTLLSACYTDTDLLDANTQNVFANLLLGYEYHTMRIFYQDESQALSQFRTLFLEAQRGYNSLNAAQKEKISFLYDKMNTIYGLYNNNMELNRVTTGNTSWDNKINNFASDVMGTLYMAYSCINDSNIEAYGAYITLVEWAQAELDALVAEIEAVEDATLKANIYKAFYYGEYSILSSFGGSGAVGIESIFYGLRSYHTYLLMNYPVIYQSYPLYQFYTDSLRQHLIDSADIMAESVVATANGTTPNFNNVSGINEFFMSYLSLDGDEWTMEDKVLFADLHLLYDFFHTAFLRYYSQRLGMTVSETNVVGAFMNLVYAYTYYQYALDNFTSNSDALATYRSDYQNAMNTFNTAYNSLTGANRTAFNEMFGEDLVDAYQQRPTASN